MFFSLPPPERKKREADEADSGATIDTLFASVREQFGASKDVGRAILNILKSRRAKDGFLVSPLQAPRSMINGKISRSRRFATQLFELERLRAVAKRAGGTLNDVILALLSGALRRFLLEQSALPDKTMTAMIPVNVRPKDDPGGGNAVGAILASLATDLASAPARLDAIIASTTKAKEQLQGMSKNAIMQYGSLLLAPILLSMIPGAAGRVRPAFNLVVSNVPGPETPLFFRGWRLEATYPAPPFRSTATPSMSLFVSGYAGTLGFGLHRVQRYGAAPPAARGVRQRRAGRARRGLSRPPAEEFPPIPPSISDYARGEAKTDNGRARDTRAPADSRVRIASLKWQFAFVRLSFHDPNVMFT